MPRQDTHHVHVDESLTSAASRCPLMGKALHAGSMIDATLKQTLGSQLDEDTYERIQEDTAALAATGAYAGMALWTVNQLTFNDEATGNLAKALAGVSLGLLTEG